MWFGWTAPYIKQTLCNNLQDTWTHRRCPAYTLLENAPARHLLCKVCTQTPHLYRHQWPHSASLIRKHSKHCFTSLTFLSNLTWTGVSHLSRAYPPLFAAAHLVNLSLRKPMNCGICSREGARFTSSGCRHCWVDLAAKAKGTTLVGRVCYIRLSSHSLASAVSWIRAHSYST